MQGKKNKRSICKLKKSFTLKPTTKKPRAQASNPSAPIAPKDEKLTIASGVLKRQLSADTQRDIAARMLALGFEPYDIQKTLLTLPLTQLRRWVKEDPDFQAAITGYEQELFAAVAAKHQAVLMVALRRLGELIEQQEKPKVALEAIDKVFRIHGKYVERVEDMTPPMRRASPDQAERLLDKGLEYLRLTRSGNLNQKKIGSGGTPVSEDDS